MKIVLLLADGFEETEAVTLMDLLRRAEYDLYTVSIMGRLEVKGGHDISLLSDKLFNDVDFNTFDMIILPGGVPGVPNLAGDDKVLEIIKKFFNEGKYIGAICAAPFVLERAGILKNKTVTCYPGWEDKLDSPNIIKDNVVVDGNIITSRGVGTAIDMGLKIVEIVSSKDKSEELRNKIVYN